MTDGYGWYVRWQRRNTQTRPHRSPTREQGPCLRKALVPSGASGGHRELIATSDVRAWTSAWCSAPFKGHAGVMQVGCCRGAGANASAQRHNGSARPAIVHIASASRFGSLVECKRICTGFADRVQGKTLRFA
jgi:hypothetical protein